jgi:hypothetical protein
MTIATLSLGNGLPKLEGVYATNYPTNEGTLLTNNFTRDGAVISCDTINLTEVTSGVLPQESLTPSANRYLASGGNRYLLYKYRIYQPIIRQEPTEVVTTFVDTGWTYTMAYKIPHYGDIDLRLKYERS